MKILVINAGSSSIKYQLVAIDGAEGVLAGGLLERIGEGESRLRHHLDPAGNTRETTRPVDAPDHDRALREIVRVLTDPEDGVLRKASEIDGIGHRVVHGGEAFQRPALIDEAVLRAIRDNIPLAPLHNPANLTGIEVALQLFPDAPQVAVFDTAFHQTMPPRAFHYAIPLSYYREHRVRRYGFHGTSHKYIAGATARYLGKPLDETSLISIHLGNGASITATRNGRCVDTSMGLTPLEGLVMGTRSGDVDPALHVFLADNANLTLPEINTLLNKQSGLKGLCGTNDVREVLAQMEAGNTDARLAMDLYCYRIRKYIGAYLAVLNGTDAIVFTAGVGENAPVVRSLVCNGLEDLGLLLDPERNQAPEKGPREINRPESRIRILVIPTNEEIEIARQTRALLEARME